MRVGERGVASLRAAAAGAAPVGDQAGTAWGQKPRRGIDRDRGWVAETRVGLYTLAPYDMEAVLSHRRVYSVNI